LANDFNATTINVVYGWTYTATNTTFLEATNIAFLEATNITFLEATERTQP
jgi:hypothetical protein